MKFVESRDEDDVSPALRAHNGTTAVARKEAAIQEDNEGHVKRDEQTRGSGAWTREGSCRALRLFVANSGLIAMFYFMMKIYTSGVVRTVERRYIVTSPNRSKLLMPIMLYEFDQVDVWLALRSLLTANWCNAVCEIINQAPSHY